MFSLGVLLYVLSIVVTCVLVLRCYECVCCRSVLGLGPRTFGCVAMGSAVLFNLKSRLLLYSAGSGVNRVQFVLSGFSKCEIVLYCQGKHCMYVWL